MEPAPSSSSSSIGDEEDVEQTTRVPEQSIEEEKNLAAWEPTLPNRQCRICYVPEEASGADPILLLGCACKGDISYGHQSCLKKWFCKRFQRNQNLDYEVCRSPLGAHLKKIIWNSIIVEVIPHSPRLLLLLQVPPDDLDHLQVPLETPDFYELPSETRRSLQASFERLEQEQRRGQSRRREAFETAQSIVANRQSLNEDGDYLTRMRSEARLEDVLLSDFLELSEVDNTGDPAAIRVFIEHQLLRIHSLDQSEDEEFDYLEYPEGRILRVHILEPEDRMHPTPEEDLLDEVLMQTVRIVDSYGENLIVLPNIMDNLFLEMEEPLDMSVDESHDDDDIPIAIPVLNPNSGGPAPVFAEAPRRADSIPSRVHIWAFSDVSASVEITYMPKEVWRTYVQECLNVSFKCFKLARSGFQ